MEKISVIIPVYKAEQFIIRCLESVVAQSYPHLEIIIVNDASPDQSDPIIQRFIATYNGTKELVYITNANNLGQSTSRNIGLNQATGDYIYFIDSDDELPTNHVIENIYDCIKQYDAEICLAEVQQIKDQQYFENTYHDIKINADILTENIINNFLENNWSAIPCNRLYQSSFLKKHHLQFVPMKAYEDELWCFQVYLFANKICFLKETTYNYYIGENENSITTVYKNDFESLEVVLLEKLKTLQRADVPIGRKPFSTHIKNKVQQLINRPDLNRSHWIKNYRALQKKLQGHPLYLIIPAPLAYYLYRYPVPRLIASNLRFQL